MLSIYLDAQLDKLRGRFNVDSENEDYVMRGPVRQVRRDVLQFRMRSDRQGQKRMNRIRPIWCPSGAYLTVLFPSPYDTVPTYDLECIFSMRFTAFAIAIKAAFMMSRSMPAPKMPAFSSKSSST